MFTKFTSDVEMLQLAQGKHLTNVIYSSHQRSINTYVFRVLYNLPNVIIFDGFFVM